MKPENYELLVEGHERRMKELKYPPEIVREFRRARAKFLAWAIKKGKI